MPLNEWPAVPDRARSPFIPGLGGHPLQGPFPLQTLPWRSSCSRATCTRCCSWTHLSPMHPPRAGSAKLRKPRGRPPHPCGRPTDPTARAGPQAELLVSGVRRDIGEGEGTAEKRASCLLPQKPGQTLWLPSFNPRQIQLQDSDHSQQTWR